MRQPVLLIFLLFAISLNSISQTFYVQVKPETQTIETFTQMMDEGAYAIHLEVTLNENNQPVVGSAQLLSNVVKKLEWHTKSYTRYEIKYIIELKKSTDYMLESKAVHDLLDSYIPLSRVTIQSEDFQILQYWKKNYPEVKISVFINNQKSIDTNLASLGFKPTVYSPKAESLTERAIKKLHKKSIKVIPWNINDASTIKRMMRWKTDGMITNTPDQSKLLGINRKVKDGN